VARFDVFPNPEGPGFLLDVQADILEGLATRVVIPLLPVEMVPRSEPRLNPIFEIDEAAHMLVTHYIASVPASVLRRPVANLSEDADTITRASDFLMQGF